MSFLYKNSASKHRSFYIVYSDTKLIKLFNEAILTINIIFNFNINKLSYCNYFL